MPQTDLGKPKGMGCDRDGNIIVVEPHYQRVNIFSPRASWSHNGASAAPTPASSSCRARWRSILTASICVTEYTVVDRVQEFSGKDKKLLNVFGHQEATPATSIARKEFAWIPQDRIYVADSCNHRIQIFSPDGKWLRTYGKAGSGPGELSYPYDIRVDKAGRQYVCEFGNSRIQVFDANDKPLEIIGGPGGAPGQFSNPWSIALDSEGNLYVADSQNHRVQKFCGERKRRDNQGNPTPLPAW